MIKLFFCGDIVYREQTTKNIIDKEIVDIMQEHDIKCCNFEAPVVVPEQSFKKLYK